MRKLANHLSKKDALARVEAEPFNRTSISFYKYVNIHNPDKLRDELWVAWTKLGVLGRIYLAKEGINAQLNVPEHNFDKFREHVDSLPMFKDVPFKVGVDERGVSFWKLTIKVRDYVLADGLEDGSYDFTNVGKHLSAAEFNQAMDQGATVVDMRNKYESDIGHFEGAVCPQVQTFREELPDVLNTLKGKEDEKILLYCTGGIRCEKTSAFLKENGFNDVNQLHGGIIAYKHQVDEQGLETKFKGYNYVFDGRAPEVITEDILGSCYSCEAPTNKTKNCANDACHELLVQCDDCGVSLENCCSKKCQKIFNLPLEKQKKLRRKRKRSREQYRVGAGGPLRVFMHNLRKKVAR